MNGEHNSFHGGLQAISGHAGHQWQVKDCHNLSAPYHSEKHNDPRRLAPGHSENEKSAQSSNECNHPRRSAPGPEWGGSGFFEEAPRQARGDRASSECVESLFHGDAPPLDGGEGSGSRPSPRFHATPDAPPLDGGEGSDEQLVWKSLPPSGGPAARPRGASHCQLFQRPALTLQELRRLIDEKTHTSACSWRALSPDTEHQSIGERVERAARLQEHQEAMSHRLVRADPRTQFIASTAPPPFDELRRRTGDQGW